MCHSSWEVGIKIIDRVVWPALEGKEREGGREREGERGERGERERERLARRKM